jgi:ribonuclease HI
VSRDATIVYTDGACQGNPGPGGWAWAVPGGPYRSGAEPATTNQRMEIRAALEAVISLDGPLEVVSDSTYVVNCFRDRWWEGWLAKGWLNSAKKPVKNRDLWQPLIDAYRADPQRIRFRWVKGHSTDPMNDLVDRLAVQAAATQTGRAGTGTPDHLGPVDKPRRHRTESSSESSPNSTESHADSAPGGGPPLPPGHLLVVTGLKPPELGGYTDNPVADRVRRRLTEILAAKRKLHPDLTVLTGLGLGAEQLGAEAAAGTGVPYVAVLAFPGVDEVWPAASRRHFAQLLDRASDAITLQRKKPDSRQAAGGALARRDAWLARHAAEALAVWDGEDGAVGRAVRTLQDHLGEEDVWVLEPSSG